MAPKKPTVTSSSTRSARVKGGSNPVVTKGEARTRAARTSLGPAPKQRPMATGGTKGPLQGGTRSPSLKANPAKLEAGPAKVGPNLRQQSTSSSAGPRSVRPPSMNSLEAKPARVGPNLGQQSTSSSAGPRSLRPAATKSSGITMSGDRAAAIKGAGNPAGPRAPKPAFGPVPTGPSERRIRSMEAGPGKVKGNLGQQSTLSSAGPRPARPPAQKPAQTPAQRGQAAVQAAQVKRGAKAASQRMGAIVKGAQTARNVLGALKTGIRGGALAAGLQAYNTRGGTISEMDPKLAKQIAAMKNKVGPKMVGPKKVGTGKVGTIAQSFDKAFAAARKAGKSGFTFKGKKYTTKMA